MTLGRSSPWPRKNIGHPYLEKKYENRLFHGTRPKDNPLPRVELEAPCQGYTHFVQLKSPTSTQLGYKVCIVKHWKPLRYISFELNRASFNVSWCPSYLQFLLPPFCVCHDLSASRMYTSCNPQVQCMKLKKIKCCSNMLKLGASVSLFLEARVHLHKLLMFVCQKTEETNIDCFQTISGEFSKANNARSTGHHEASSMLMPQS